MNVFEFVRGQIVAVVAGLIERGQLRNVADLSRIVVEPPKDTSHGDMATNVALVLSKEVGISPRELADLLVPLIMKIVGVSHAAIAGPGFINLMLDDTLYHDVLKNILASGPEFGQSQVGQGEAVNVEYVSANPTGPLHVGHGRGAVFGDALASLLGSANYRVVREYYINDAGAQVDVLARSAFLRYCEALGQDIGEIPDGLYPGDYLKPVGSALAASYGDRLTGLPESEWLDIVRSKAIEMMLDLIKEDLAVLGIRHDLFFSERSLALGEKDVIRATIDDMINRDLVYQGRLLPPKGAPVEDWEDREQTLFRATDFGDDVDRPLLKSDGSYTYFAADIAYHRSKFDRGFSNMIDVWGADHSGYIKRMTAAVKAVTGGKAALDVKICQLVRLLRDGQPVKMSKRSGDFVTLREVVDEVGADAVRFMMLFRKNDASLDFDLSKVVEQSKENPVFYVQYAHARCCSIRRQAENFFHGDDLGDLHTSDFNQLGDVSEKTVIRRLSQYPRLIEAAALAHEPHRIAFYLYDLAADFHALWNRGKDDPVMRFIIEDNKVVSLARLGLVESVKFVIASGLGVLGVSAPQEMR
jgi:arginyl-tRNA synthetase